MNRSTNNIYIIFKLYSYQQYPLVVDSRKLPHIFNNFRLYIKPSSIAFYDSLTEKASCEVSPKSYCILKIFIIEKQQLE